MYLHNQIFYWQIDRTYKFTELEAFFKVLSNSSLVMKSMPVSSFGSKLSLEAACSSVFISVFNLITNSSLTSIELTTCFHEFSENKSTNFFNNIFQQKMKTNSLWVKQGIFFLSLEHMKNQNKYCIIFGRKNLQIRIRKIRENIS